MRIVHPDELKSMRLSAGLTQEGLAKAAGLTQAYIAKIESGDADPKISTMERISEALYDVDLERDEIKARQVMTDPIIFVEPNDSVGKAIGLMETSDISQLPVIQESKQVGSLSEKTIIHEISKGEKMFGLADERVEEVMKDPFPTVGGDTDIETIFHLLEHNPAVLVFEDGGPAGIITKADILQLSTTREG